MCGSRIRAAEQAENEMRKIRNWIAVLLAFTMTLSLGMGAEAASGDRPILALGSDFSAEQ